MTATQKSNDLGPGRLVPQSHNLSLKAEVGKAQGYGTRETIIRAANRALRWVRQPRNQGFKPPRHIADKMLLIGVKSSA